MDLAGVFHQCFFARKECRVVEGDPYTNKDPYTSYLSKWRLLFVLGRMLLRDWWYPGDVHASAMCQGLCGEISPLISLAGSCPSGFAT